MIGSMTQTLRATPEQESGIVSPETLKERRALARRLMEGAVDVSPVQHWTQGAARMAQALQGVAADWAADREEKRGQDAWKNSGGAKLDAMLGGMGGASPAPAADLASPAVAASPSPTTKPAGMPDVDPRIRDGIVTTAKALGIDPVDLATTISYETSGTFDPMKDGPRTQWGQHRGLIQFGEPQARENGVNWDDPIGSQLGENGAVANYLRKAGVKPGMGLLDVYSAINAGAPGLYNRSDANNGGAPGTVRDKVEGQMAGHRAKAMALLGMPMDTRPEAVSAQPAVMRGQSPEAMNAIATERQAPQAIPAQATQGATAAPITPGNAQASTGPVSGDPSRMSLAQLLAMQNSPAFAYAPKGTQGLVAALIQRAVTAETKDPRDGQIKDLTIAEKRANMARDAEMTPLNKQSKILEISKGEREMAGYRPASPEEKARLGYDKDTPIQIGPDGRAYADNTAARPNVEIIRDAATGEIIAVDKNNIDSGIKRLREAGPSSSAPATKQIKQPDGSEVAVQWDVQTRQWVPLKAPEGGNAVKAPGKLTEQQAKDLVYYNRGLQSMEVMGSGDSLTGTQGLVGATVGQIPVIGNYAKSENYQQAEQASRNFLLSVLRKDTGAAVTPSEEKIYGEVFLPRPGDPPSLVKQKFEARKQAIDAIRDGLGPAEVLALGQRLTRREDAKVPAPDKPTNRPADKDPLGLFQ